MFQKVSIVMVSSHSTGVYLNGKGPLPDRFEIPRRRLLSNRSVLSNACLSLLNADGKVVYWLIPGLFLLIILSWWILWQQGGGITDKESASVIIADRNDVLRLPHRYKIEKPARTPVKAVVAETSSQSEDDKTFEGPPAFSATMEVAPGQPFETVGPADQQAATPPIEAGEHAVKAVSGCESIFEQEPLDVKSRDSERELPPSEQTAPAAASNPSEKPGTAPLAEAEITSQQGDKGSGKRFFVQADIANVRNRPSMKSKVLFQLGNGCSVTVTDEREGWYRVKEDDGRLGWVYHTLVSDSLEAQKDLMLALREIKAIRAAPPVNQTAKVFFELSDPYIPEILILDEKRPRIVCDFFDATIAVGIGNRIALNNGIVQTIRIGLHRQPQFKVRVVLDLAPGHRYKAGQSSVNDADTFALEIRVVEGM